MDGGGLILLPDAIPILKPRSQCDQIGPCLKALSEKFAYRFSPNNWQLLKPF